jgi:rubrerythrin
MLDPCRNYTPQGLDLKPKNPYSMYMEHGLFRCRICGEVYFGTHPSHCPFCGAHKGFLVAINIWKDENQGVSLSSQELEFLKTTQGLEYENTRFYRAAQNRAENDELKGFFKYLSKIENEHYNVATKLLGADKDQSIFEPGEEMGTDIKNLEHSKVKEKHASELYASFIPKCETPRLKTFFRALSDVEADHIELDTEEIDKISN